ncbi:MAG: aromatic acid exporter family protein [Bacilli bacterium]
MEKRLRFALYLKMLIGFMTSFTIAYLLKMPTSYTAGVIAVLNLWYSRDNVVKTALIRIISSLIGLATSALLFWLFGYKIYNLFLMAFIVLALLYIFKLEYGATPALVLIGQQWAQQTPAVPLNALLTLVIGVVPALLLNLFTFRKSKILLVNQQKLDIEIAHIFTYFAKDETYDFTIVDKVLKDTRASLQIALDNYEVKNIMQNFHYINMRTDQINVLRRIVNDLNVLEDSPYKKEITTYLLQFKDRIGLEDYASDLLVKHDELVTFYRGLDLPKTRLEFEHRALLFAILEEIKLFLTLKLDYHKIYPCKSQLEGKE